MTIPLCLILLCGALCCAWLGRAGTAARLLLANLFLIMSVGTGIVPLLLLSHAQVPKSSDISWQPHSTIVLLGAGTLAATTAGPRIPFYGFGRIVSAAQAYFACRRQIDDCKIVVSGGDPQRHGEAEASVYASALEKIQVPRGDIITEDKSNNTWRNASNSTKVILKERAVVIVTSGFQLPRALLYFSHFRANVRGIAGDEMETELSVLPSSANFLETDALLHEQIGVARYHIYNALRLNETKT